MPSLLLGESFKVKRFWISLAMFLLFLVGATFYLLRFPQHYFKQEWVISFLEKQDMTDGWTWDEFQIDVTSPRFLEYFISVSTTQLNA
jgi:hypothetical protein